MSQLVLSFIVVVVITAIALGVPSIWLLRDQLNHQAWTQVAQGIRATRALYTAQQSEIKNLASLTAQRPTLHELLVQGDWPALETYLQTLQTGVELDLVAVCDQRGQLFISTANLTQQATCQEMASGGFARPTNSNQVWLTASTPIDNEAIPGLTVIVGIRLDQAFVQKMRTQTGLEQTLWANYEPMTTTLAIDASALTFISSKQISTQLPALERSFRYEVDGLPYYATRFKLDSEESIEVEVALGIAEMMAMQHRLIAISVISILGGAAIVSLLGIYLAREISRPLMQLADTAKDFSQGDLNSTVAVESRLRDVNQVAQALENARSDLLQAMTHLRREKEWGDHLLASIVEGIMTLDKNNRITYFSHGAERITGWDRDEVLNVTCDQVFHLAKQDDHFSQSIPSPGQRQKLTITLAKGRLATLAITGAKLAPTDIEDAQVVLVFRDVSEEEAVHQLMGHFLANIAHEFRTPLSALAASIELLLDQAHERKTDMQELLTSLHLGILGLRTLVDNLLESASIETGRFRVSPRRSDLGKIISEAAQTMQPLLEKYGQHLTVELPTEIPFVLADAKRIVQVMVNLLSNANKYGPSDAEITIRAKDKKARVRVEVIDQGPGIQASEHDDLFVRFVHPDLPDESAKMGVGLGLSVVKAIVEAHGGKVGVENHPQRGAIFWFTLPKAREE